MSIPLILDLPEKLKYYIEVIIANPRILHEPELAVIKKLIEHFGGKIPKLDELPHEKPKEEKPEPEPELEPQPEPEPKPEIQPEPEPEPEPEHESEREESDLELDTARVVEPGTGVHQKLEYLTLQPTEEEIAESQAKRSEAVAAFIEKDYEKAIEHYTEAIMLNPQASLLYAKRGEVYLSTNKLSACIRDCNRALELNPDSAAAHKFRGRAYHLLGIFEEAANDLRFACKFDFDEQADEWLREVTPNVSPLCIENKKIQLKRKVISLEEKIQILNRLKDGEKVSSVAKSFNLNEATVRTIKNSEQKIRKNVAEGCMLRAKCVARTRDIDVVRMEQALISWIEDCLYKRIPLNGNIIRHKALQIYRHLKKTGHSSTGKQMHSFCASKGWFERLKVRFSLQSIKFQGERTLATAKVVKKFKMEVPKIIYKGQYTAD